MGIKNLTPINGQPCQVKVKGKSCNFEAYLCGSLYFTFKTSFQPYAFYSKQLQALFKDHLDRPKATGSFKVFIVLAHSTWTSDKLFKFYIFVWSFMQEVIWFRCLISRKIVSIQYISAIRSYDHLRFSLFQLIQLEPLMHSLNFIFSYVSIRQ